MSKRMHIYAAAIDPLRKKFGIPAKAVAEKVGEILSHNEKLAYDAGKLKEEAVALKSAAAVSEASVTAMQIELATAREQIAQLHDKIAEKSKALMKELTKRQIAETVAVDYMQELPTAVAFMRFSPPKVSSFPSLIAAQHVDPAELLETTPAIRDWLLHIQEHKHLGAVYDGGDFVVVSVKPLGEQPPVPDAELVA